MSQAATELYICLSIFWTLICLANYGRCHLDGVNVAVGFDGCSSYKGNYNGLQNIFASFFCLDYTSGYHKTVPVAESEDVCGSSDLLYFPSTLYGFHSEAQCSWNGLDISRSGSGASPPKQSYGQDGNASWSSDHLVFHLPDGETFTCSLNYGEVDHGMSSPSAKKADHTVLSSCRGHLRHQKETRFNLKNFEIEKSLSLDSSSPRVNINPPKLDWGQNYLYHPSVAFLRLENTCNESVLKVYELFSTDSQFYPFNFSQVDLGPGEVTLISFVFLPKWLGLSSAELVLQTSVGSFLVEAKGFAFESPHRLRPLVGVDVSFGGWLRRMISLSNPFDGSIHLEEVTAWVLVFESSGPLLAEAVCSKQSSQDSNEHSYSDSKTLSSSESGKTSSGIMEIRSLNNGVISPHRTESILEMGFSPDSEGPVYGAICMQLLRPIEGKQETVVVPFEAELRKTAMREDTDGLLSVSIEAVGHCDASKTTISVLVRNNASNLVKVVRISEVIDKKKLLQIKYAEGLLLFPGVVTQVALITYESSVVKYYSFPEMVDVNTSCMLQILTNDSISPILGVPCHKLFGVCSRQWQDLPAHQPDIVDFSNKRTGSLISNGKLPVSIKALMDAEVDEIVLQNGKDQSTMSGLFVLDDHELVYPMVPIGRYHSKSITVNNPSEHPVIVQLILNSEEIMDNCKAHYGHLQPLSSTSIHDSSTQPSRYGFSMVNNAVTEAYLHPYESASLGPILFYPSNRCEWRSSALIRNNLSGVEWLSLRGIGGSLSVVLLEGSELVHRLEFNIDMPFPLKMSSSDISPSIDSATSGCRKSLSKKLSVVNAGDFPVTVQRMHVSGTECWLDGFVLHNCKGFSLEPGESIELWISYQTDFSAPVVQRDLELMLAAGIIVVPMKASLPLHIFNFCRKSIFWGRVKKCCVAVVLAAILLSLFWFLVPQMLPDHLDYFSKGEKIFIHVGMPRGKSPSLNCNQGNGKPIVSTKKGCLRSVQKDEATAITSATYSNSQLGDLEPGVVAKHTYSSLGCQSEISPSSDAPKEIGSSPSLCLKSLPVENIGIVEVTQPVSLTVKTRKDKRRRPRKRKGAGSGLSSFIEVSSSQSGTSTPPSPVSPLINLSPEETCSPSLGKSQPRECSPFCVTGDCHEKYEEVDPTVKFSAFGPEGDSRNYSDSLFSIQQQPPCPRKAGSTRPVLQPSATFPGMGRSAAALPCSSPSRLGIASHARAPGPKLLQAVEAEQARPEDNFTYDIWGNHFSGLHLMFRPNDPSTMTPEAIGGDSDSFFLRGPQQILMTNCRPRSDEEN